MALPLVCCSNEVPKFFPLFGSFRSRKAGVVNKSNCRSEGSTYANNKKVSVRAIVEGDLFRSARSFFSFLVVSCLVLSGLVWSCLVWSGLVWSCLVLSCLVLSCLVLSCLVLSHPKIFVRESDVLGEGVRGGAGGEKNEKFLKKKRNEKMNTRKKKISKMKKNGKHRKKRKNVKNNKK